MEGGEIRKALKENFPFDPYPGQLSLSEELFGILGRGEVGIFESPTGTGKSMAMVVGALTWMQNHRDDFDLKFKLAEGSKVNLQEVKTDTKDEDSFPDWFDEGKMMKNQFVTSEQRNLRLFADEMIKKYDAADVGEDPKAKEIDDELIRVIEEQFGSTGAKRIATMTTPVVDKPSNNCFKIIYATRTHSQIKEFLSEFKKTKFAKNFHAIELASRNLYCFEPSVNPSSEVEKRFGHKSVKTNDQKTGPILPVSNFLMKEKCNDLRKTKNGCKYFQYLDILNSKFTLVPNRVLELGEQYKIPANPNKNGLDVSKKYADKPAVCDIEDIITHFADREKPLCAYFATKESAKYADILCVPYTSLLSETARESLGLDLNLDRSIILFDEAHNIAETFASLNTVALTLEEISDAIEALEKYLQFYKLRLSTSTIYYINQISQILKNLKKFVLKRVDVLSVQAAYPPPSSTQTSSPLTEEIAVSALLSEIKCLDYDLGRLKIVIEECELTRKLYRFASKKKEDAKGGSVAGSGVTNQTSVTTARYTNLEKIFGFCLSLLRGYRYEAAISLEVESGVLTPAQENPPRPSTSTSPDKPHQNAQSPGRDLSKIKLTYFPLDIGPLFSDLVNKTHAVLFTGGTMKPKGLLERVLATCSKKVVGRDFPAVVPLHNVNCTVLSSLPSADLHFVQGNSAKIEQNLAAVADLLVGLDTKIPGGVIAFFTSYQVLAKFRELAAAKLEQRSKRKAFFDSSGSSGIFEKYSEAIKNSLQSGGPYAYLFTVMGGKLSEGINFKDELARGVVLVGLPYPNRYASEIKLRMAYFDTTCQHKATGQPTSFSGAEYYQSQCMKVVNQTVGRAVRHSKDYASIILIDRRFAQNSVLGGMPDWVTAHKQEAKTLDELVARVEQFFAGSVKP